MLVGKVICSVLNGYLQYLPYESFSYQWAVAPWNFVDDKISFCCKTHNRLPTSFMLTSRYKIFRWLIQFFTLMQSSSQERKKNSKLEKWIDPSWHIHFFWFQRAKRLPGLIYIIMKSTHMGIYEYLLISSITNNSLKIPFTLIYVRLKSIFNCVVTHCEIILK